MKFILLEYYAFYCVYSSHLVGLKHCYVNDKKKSNHTHMHINVRSISF